MINKTFNALFAGSCFSMFKPDGTFLLKLNNAAAAINKAPTPAYIKLTLFNPRLFVCSSEAAAVPNSNNETMIGPIMVPKLLIPPPKLILPVAVDSSPNEMANGLAAVCCKLKPSATINKPTNIPENVFAFTAIIMAIAPIALNNKPYTILFL